MQRGDTFTSVMDVNNCMVCGESASFAHLCVTHSGQGSWGDRFVHELTHAERLEYAPKIAAGLGVSITSALNEYVPHSDDYSSHVRDLMCAIHEIRTRTEIESDQCKAPHEGDWWESLDHVGRRYPVGVTCTKHRLDNALFRLSVLEDKMKGTKPGVTLRDGLAEWGQRLAASRVSKIAASTKGMSVGDIVQNKLKDIA